jgi:hypothetical protein
MIEIKKVANDRMFLGGLLDYYFDKCVRYFNDVEDAYRIDEEVHAFLDSVGRPRFPHPGFGALLTDEEFLHSRQCDRILRLFVRNVDVIRFERLEFCKDGSFVDYNVRYTDIWSDDRLPHYYIIHHEPEQAYLLLDKYNGTLLPWRFHQVCASDDRQLVIGEHWDGKFRDYGLCAIRITNPPDKHIPNSNDINAEIVPFHQIMPGADIEQLPVIFPFGTNVPFHYTPLKEVEDIMFMSRLRRLMQNDHEDEDKDDEDPSTGSVDVSAEDVDLPF